MYTAELHTADAEKKKRNLQQLTTPGFSGVHIIFLFLLLQKCTPAKGPIKKSYNHRKEKAIRLGDKSHKATKNRDDYEHFIYFIYKQLRTYTFCLTW